MKFLPRRDSFQTAFWLLLCGAANAFAQPIEPVLTLAKKEKPLLLETLKSLVSIESGSADYEGLGKLAALVAGRLKTLGGKVELVDPTDVTKWPTRRRELGLLIRFFF